MAVVAVMLVAALRTVGSSARARQIQASCRRGPALARELISEILPAHYADPNETPVFGIEETEDASVRSTFDDVDDYHGWSSCPPCSRDGAVIPNFVGWRRTVAVQCVDPDDVTGTAVSDMGLKRIIVTVTDPQGRQSVMSALRSNRGVYEQRPSEETTYVSWVGVRLQIGGNTHNGVVSAANPLNRIPARGE